MVVFSQKAGFVVGIKGVSVKKSALVFNFMLHLPKSEINKKNTTI